MKDIYFQRTSLQVDQDFEKATSTRESIMYMGKNATLIQLLHEY